MKILSDRHKKAISEWVLRHFDSVGRKWTINKCWYRTQWGRKTRVYEHRKIMEEYLWRKLTSDEVVHHINGNKLDNRIENLEVISKSEHSRMHTSKRQDFLCSRIWISPTNKTSEENINKIIALRESWMKLSDIKQTLGISLTTIIKYLHLYHNEKWQQTKV